MNILRMYHWINYVKITFSIRFSKYVEDNLLKIGNQIRKHISDY